MAVVVFDPALFKEAFPEFASVPDARLTVLFSLATGIVDNTDASPVVDVVLRTNMFYYIVAHLLTLFGYTSTTGAVVPPIGVVGRVASATEGSVSTSLAYSVPTNASEAWWTQTQYGALYWMLSLPYRSFRYVDLGQSGVGNSVDFLNRGWLRSGRGPGGIPPGGV